MLGTLLKIMEEQNHVLTSMSAVVVLTSAVLWAALAAIYLEAINALAILGMKLTEQITTASILTNVTPRISAELTPNSFAPIKIQVSRATATLAIR